MTGNETGRLQFKSNDGLRNGLLDRSLACSAEWGLHKPGWAPPFNPEWGATMDLVVETEGLPLLFS